MRAQLLDLHRDELTRREVSIAELVLCHLWEHLIVKLHQEKELAGGHFVLRRRERELNLHDVALGAECTIVPKLFILTKLIVLEGILEGHCANVAILELLLDAHPKNKAVTSNPSNINLKLTLDEEWSRFLF